MNQISASQPLQTGDVFNPGNRIAYIEASWHQDILDPGRIAFLEELDRLGIARDRVDHIDVPGGFEIPLQAQLLAKSGRYAAIVGAAFIVDGGIYRHEFVATAVIDGLMRVQLDSEVPVLSMALTPQQFHEHGEHIAFFQAHFKTKGIEVARACAATLEALQSTRQLLAAG